MAVKRRRGAGWQYVLKRKGLLPKPVYVTFRDEAEGDEYVARLEALLARGIVPVEIASDTGPGYLRASLQNYLNTTEVSALDREQLEIIANSVRWDLRLADCTFTWAVKWVSDFKREANLAPTTIRHRVGALARALDWALAHGMLATNPLRALPRGYATYTEADERETVARGGRPKTDTERDRRMTADEEKAIRAVLITGRRQSPESTAGRALVLKHRAALALLFDLALETAMRMRELFTLGADQVDMEHRTIFLDRTKNGSKRQVPLSSVALGVLTPWLDERGDSELVFPWCADVSDARTVRKTTALLSRQWARVFEAAGCPDLHFHDLRHEATSRLYERTTLSDAQIAKITGHKDPRMLMRYANLRASALAARLW